MMRRVELRRLLMPKSTRGIAGSPLEAKARSLLGEKAFRSVGKGRLAVRDNSTGDRHFDFANRRISGRIGHTY